MEPSLEEILEAINNSGYLFEQEVATIFENKDFYVKTNVAFKDEDEEKSREIDVMAYKRYFHDEEKKITIGVRIICECKNNTNPFVFIGRNKSNSDKDYSPPNFQFPVEEYKISANGNSNSYYLKSGFDYYNLKRYFPFHLSDYKAVQFCKVVRKGKDWNAMHEGIYDSILIPVFKCLEHFKSYDGQYKNSEWKHYTIYFPIVVLNSKIYFINSHLDPIDLNVTPYIPFIRDIHSKSMKGSYLLDFVSVEHLQNYIENNITKFVSNFIETVIKETNAQHQL